LCGVTGVFVLVVTPRLWVWSRILRGCTFFGFVFYRALTFAANARPCSRSRSNGVTESFWQVVFFISLLVAPFYFLQ